MSYRSRNRRRRSRRRREGASHDERTVDAWTSELNARTQHSREGELQRSANESDSEYESEYIYGAYVNEVNVREAWDSLGTDERRLDLNKVILTPWTIEFLLEQGRNLKHLLQQQSQRKVSRQAPSTAEECRGTEECIVQRINLVQCTFSAASSNGPYAEPKWDEFLSLVEPKIYVLDFYDSRYVDRNHTLRKNLQGVSQCHCLEELRICKADLSIPDPRICETLHTALTASNCKIQKLHLRSCRMSSAVVLCLGGIVKSHSLGFSELHLEDCKDDTGKQRDMSDMDVVFDALVESNSRNTLCSLSLAYSQELPPSTWGFLTVLLKESPRLERLFLSNCKSLFTSVETTNNELYLRFLAVLRGNKTMKLFDLMNCGITDALAGSLFRALERNTSLIEINYGTTDLLLNRILRRNILLQQTARFLSLSYQQRGDEIICTSNWPFWMEELGGSDCRDPSALYAFLTGTIGSLVSHPRFCYST